MSQQSLDFILRNIAKDIQRLADKGAERKGAFLKAWKWTIDDLMGDAATLRLQADLRALALRRADLSTADNLRVNDAMNDISDALQTIRHRRDPLYQRVVRLVVAVAPWLTSLLLPRVERLTFVRTVVDLVD